MTKLRVMYGAAIAAAALLALAPSAATAQGGISDVVMAGRAHGVELRPATRARMEAFGADAFEFENVWNRRIEAIQARRAAYQTMASSMAPGAVVTTSASELRRAGAALTGTFRMPVLLGRPTDGTQPHTVAAYQERMFGVGGTAYSLSTLYDEMSRGAFQFTGDVIDWTALPQNSAFYYGDGPFGPEFGQTGLFMQHTLAAADPTVDFRIYDNDGPDGVPNSGDDDGYVDLAAFMYPAIGQECDENQPGIWAHRFTMSSWGIPNYVTNDLSNKAGFGNIRVRDYIIQGGLDCDGSLQEIGVVAHEAGHGFGIPDLYDTDASDGDGNGIGEWGLMGSGNWNQPESPAHMEAHSKAFLGWIDVVTITADTTLTIEPIIESGTAYRINVGHVSNEYFLLENRQQLGSDSFLNGTGLLIFHVDSTRFATRKNSNSVNSVANHKGLDLEEADGLNQLDTPNNRGDAGDAWPGSSNRSTFNATSNPNSGTYFAGASNIVISNIDETAGGDITLSIDVPDMVTFGDVNGDDAVTAADLDLVLAYAVGETGPDYSLIDAADVDDDGDVDTRDAYIIHAFLEGVATTQFRVGAQGYL